jgi:hypothetical protein
MRLQELAQPHLGLFILLLQHIGVGGLVVGPRIAAARGRNARRGGRARRGHGAGGRRGGCRAPDRLQVEGRTARRRTLLVIGVDDAADRRARAHLNPAAGHAAAQRRGRLGRAERLRRAGAPGARLGSKASPRRCGRGGDDGVWDGLADGATGGRAPGRPSWKRNSTSSWNLRACSLSCRFSNCSCSI